MFARRGARWGAAAVAALGLATIWLFATTHYSRIPYGFARDQAGFRILPVWSKPCWHANRPPFHRPYSLPCATVDGIVVYRQSHDPDGDGDGHVVVFADGRFVTVKYVRAEGRIALPGFGARVHAVGVVRTGHLHSPVITATAPPGR